MTLDISDGSPAEAAQQQLMAAVADRPGAEWATAEVCERYLKARNGNVQRATTMLQASLVWRQEFGVANLVQDHRAQLLHEGATGKLRVSEHTDLLGRPVLIMTPSRKGYRGL